MIIIKNIETLNVPDDRWKIIMAQGEFKNLNKFDPSLNSSSHDLVDIKNEEIVGRTFVRVINNQKEVFCIGMTKRIQDLIGLPMECFDQMERKVKRLYNEKQVLQREITVYKSMNLWRRILYVFWPI